MIDKGFIEKVAELGVQSATPKVIHPEAEASHVYLIAKADGTVERHEAPDGPRRHATSDIDSLCALAAESVAAGKRPEFWYDRKGVQVILDPANRRNFAHFSTSLSPQIGELARFENKAKLTPADLIRAVRVVFRGMTDVDVLDFARKVRVNVSSAAEQTATKRSIGRDAELQLGDGKTLPDTITFDVPVFAQGSLQYVTATVETSLEFEENGGSPFFLILPLAGAIERAVTRGEGKLADLILKTMVQDHKAEPGEQFGIYFGDESGIG